MDFGRLSQRYRGERADKYDRVREQTAGWAREQQAVESILATLPPNLSVLDIPVGTGRFIELYGRLGLSATGIDVSPDMLARAQIKADESGAPIVLRQGDIRKIDAPDGAFDVVVCVRFLNWIDLEGVRSALRELSRVSSRHLVVSASHFLPLREINFFSGSGLRAFAGQLARRFKTQVMRNARKRRIIFHEKQALHAAFADLGLDIGTSVCTEPGRRGVGSFIYLLEKKAPRAQTAP